MSEANENPKLDADVVVTPDLQSADAHGTEPNDANRTPPPQVKSAPKQPARPAVGDLVTPALNPPKKNEMREDLIQVNRNQLKLQVQLNDQREELSKSIKVLQDILSKQDEVQPASAWNIQAWWALIIGAVACLILGVGVGWNRGSSGTEAVSLPKDFEDKVNSLVANNLNVTKKNEIAALTSSVNNALAKLGKPPSNPKVDVNELAALLKPELDKPINAETLANLLSESDLIKKVVTASVAKLKPEEKQNNSPNEPSTKPKAEDKKPSKDPAPNPTPLLQSQLTELAKIAAAEVVKSAVLKDLQDARSDLKLRDKAISDLKEEMAKLKSQITDLKKPVSSPDGQDVLIVALNSRDLRAPLLKRGFEQFFQPFPRDKDGPLRVGLVIFETEVPSQIVKFDDKSPNFEGIGEPNNNATEGPGRFGLTLKEMFDAKRPRRRAILIASSSCPPLHENEVGWREIPRVDVVLIRQKDWTEDEKKSLLAWHAFCLKRNGSVTVLPPTPNQSDVLAAALTALCPPTK